MVFTDNIDVILGWVEQSVLGLFRKFSLWHLIVTNACCLCSFWILSLVSWLIVFFFTVVIRYHCRYRKRKNKQKLFKKATFGSVESLSLSWIKLNQFIDFIFYSLLQTLVFLKDILFERFPRFPSYINCILCALYVLSEICSEKLLFENYTLFEKYFLKRCFIPKIDILFIWKFCNDK